MQQVLARLTDSSSASPPDPIDRMVILRLADLKQMDRWGIRIRGETLSSYFDLGSLDDVDPRYPVTPEEAEMLMHAMKALTHGKCEASPWLRRWPGAV